MLRLVCEWERTIDLLGVMGALLRGGGGHKAGGSDMCEMES